MQRRTEGQRLFQLDALRGLAAVVVVFHHLHYAFSDRPGDWWLLPFFSGESAVVLFFVLSGYVLSLPYWNGRSTPYGPYLVRRLCRVYLPFLGAFLLSLLAASHFLGRSPPLSEWFQTTWHTPLSRHLVVSQLLLWPTPEINTAFWSLRYELQMSALMPLLCRLLRRGNAVLVTAVPAVLLFWNPAKLDPYDWHFLVSSLQIAVLFMIGATLARYRAPVQRFFAEAGSWGWVIFAVSLPLYYLFSARFALRFPDSAAMEIFARQTELLAGVGAAGIIASALHLPPLARLLKHSVAEYLGRISFSLYVLQGTALFALMDIFYLRMRTKLLVLLILAMTFAAAHVYCRVVEEPSIRLGRWLSRRVAERLHPRPKRAEA